MAALTPMVSLAGASTAPFSVYVGGYAPNCEGIYRFAADAATGHLRPAGLTPNPHSPSWLQADPARPGLLYAANEGGGSVHVYRQQADGAPLQLLQALPSGGEGPVHLSLHPTAPFAFVPHYGSAELAVLRRAADGQLSPVGLHPSCDRSQPEDCRLGPARALTGPPGSFALSGHEAPHMHMAQSTRDGRFVLASDLGRDRLAVWPFNLESGALGRRQDLALSPGAGPRHFVFHPKDATQLYLLNEQASTLAWLQLEPQSGRLSPRAEISSLPQGFAGTNFAADLIASADGRFLYALNRLHDSIAVFALAADGAPRLIAHEWTRGSYPRSARFSPCGRWFYVCNQRSDHVAVFAVDAATGLPRFAGQYVAVPSPACAEVMALPVR
jgi:6-phosphogluconolactonase (cycloisomerase 2 family)